MSSSKEKSSVKQNRLLEVWKQFRRNRGAMIGLVVLIFLILIAVFADVIWDYDTDITAMQVGVWLIRLGPITMDAICWRESDMEPDIPWPSVLLLYLWEVR